MKSHHYYYHCNNYDLDSSFFFNKEVILNILSNSNSKVSLWGFCFNGTNTVVGDHFIHLFKIPLFQYLNVNSKNNDSFSD